MIRKLLFFILFALPLVVFAQEMPTYEKKMFISPEGKLYVNGESPLYLWMSTSADESAKKHRLTSQESEKYTNPMYLDTEGYNSIHSPSAVDPETRKPVYPLQDIIFELYRDSEPPKTVVGYGESRPFNSEGKLYVMNNTVVELTSMDELSGVESIYCSIDGEAYKKYSAPIAFTEEREYNVKFYAVDNVGNVEGLTEISYVYDKSSPTTAYAIDGDEHNKVLSGRSKIDLKAEDKGIGVQKIVFSIDDGKEYTYQYPLRAANISQGQHKVSYYAIDKAGNKEAVKTYDFYVDKSAPTIIEEVIAKTFFANGKEYASGKAQLKLTAFDNKAGVKEIRYSINGGEYQVYTKPVFLTVSSGNLDIKTYAIDNVENKSNSQTANEKAAIPYIDLSGPTLRHSFGGPQFTTRDTVFVNSKTKIYLKGYDKEAGMNRIEYRVDGKENLTYSEGFSIAEEGVHTVNLVGYDNVENSSSSSFFVKVDNQGPEIDCTFSAPVVGKVEGKNSYPHYVMVFFSGYDDATGLENIKYSFGNGSGTTTYAHPVNGLSSGMKKITLTATDKLGNKTVKEIEFNVEH